MASVGCFRFLVALTWFHPEMQSHWLPASSTCCVLLCWKRAVEWASAQCRRETWPSQKWMGTWRDFWNYSPWLFDEQTEIDGTPTHCHWCVFRYEDFAHCRLYGTDVKLTILHCVLSWAISLKMPYDTRSRKHNGKLQLLEQIQAQPSLFVFAVLMRFERSIQFKWERDAGFIIHLRCFCSQLVRMLQQ